MKIFIVDPYHPMFLDHFYQTYPEILAASYQDQLQALLNQKFGTADFYSRNFASLGHNAAEFIVNAEALQKQWTKEQRFRVKRPLAHTIGERIPYIRRFVPPVDWLNQITLAQIEEMRPDVLYCQNLSILKPETLRTAKSIIPFVVGQTGVAIPPDVVLSYFDLILSPAPFFAEQFKAAGIPCEYIKIGFETSLLTDIPEDAPSFDTVFIGGFSQAHRSGTELFEQVGRQVKIDFWGYGIDGLPEGSVIRRSYHGPAWGREMYQILRRAKICINRHIDGDAGRYAGNMRLFEATGMGALLITDHKENIDNFFVVDKEIVTYRSADELAYKIRYYLKHEDERERIARAGQKRTLRDHTYQARIAEITSALEKHQP